MRLVKFQVNVLFSLSKRLTIGVKIDEFESLLVLFSSIESVETLTILSDFVLRRDVRCVDREISYYHCVSSCHYRQLCLVNIL